MASPRRILIVERCEDGTVGGSHQALYDLVKTIDRRTFQPLVLFYQSNRFVQPIRDLDVQVITYDAERQKERAPHEAGDRFGKIRSMIEAPFRRVRLLRKLHIDLLHLNNSPAEGADDWLPAAWMVGVPTVVTGMGQYVPPERKHQRWLARQHDLVVAISGYVRNTMIEHGLSPSKIRTIPLGVDIDGFRARVRRSRSDVRRSLGVGEHQVLLAMIGNIRRWKGQDIVVSALQHLSPDMRSRVHVIFVGDTGPADRDYHEEVASRVRSGSLQSVVTFLGARTDVPELVNATDIQVHASRRPEPFGLVVVEGMSLGKPVVATHFGGPAEVLTRESGITFDPEQPEQLTRIIERLVQDPGLRERIGAAALERVRAFDAVETTRALEAAYNDVLRRAVS